MVKDVLHSEEFERERHHENAIRRIASLNDMKSAGDEDPPTVQEFPEQSPTIFPQITYGAVPFFGHRMPIDVDSIENLMASPVSLTSGTKYADVITVLTQCTCLFPDTAVKRDR